LRRKPACWTRETNSSKNNGVFWKPGRVQFRPRAEKTAKTSGQLGA
jgi:hypothetical protein